jgi:oligoendopeptidase F
MNTTIALIAPDKRSFLPADFKLGEWEALEPYYKTLVDRDISSQDKFEAWLKDWDELYAVVSEDMRLKYVSTSIDTTDEEAKKELEKFYIHVDPKMKPWENKLQQMFNASPLKESLPEDFKNLKRGIEKDLALFTEKNIELSKDLSLMENEYAETTGAFSITYQGKELTMPQAGVFMKKIDRKVREDVYMLSRERENQDADKLDDLMDRLVKKRHQLALNAGYENYRDYMFDEKHRFDYTAKDCEAFHESVATAIIPLLKKMDDDRKAAMKVDALKPWDMVVDPLQQAPLQPFEKTEDFVSKTVDCFNKLDPYFGACIANMYETGMLDLESRKGKAPGGYMMAMPETGVPFIFMNHASSEGDVRVMVHEGGHAIHSFLDHAIPFANMRQTPSEVAELASMSMELFSLENWESFYPNESDLKRAKRNHLEGLLKMLPSVAKGDAFQHWMYTNPEHTTQDRRAKWMELNKIYGTGLVDSEGLEKFQEVGYQGILHFYQVPFYYIEYGFAQLGAIAMWRNYKSDKEQAITAYKKALGLGYTRSIPEIYEAADIRFDFSAGYVKDLADFVQDELKKL